MKTLNVTLIIASIIVVFASSCSDPSKEIFPENGPRIENKDTNPGNGMDDTSKDENTNSGNKNNGNSKNESTPKEEDDKNLESGCGIKISTTELPAGIRTFITEFYTQKPPHYYMTKAEICREDGKITKYTVFLNGPNQMTLKFDGDGHIINQ